MRTNPLPLPNLMETMQVYNSFAENKLVITKVISQTGVQKKHLINNAMLYFLVLKKLPEKVRENIAAFLGHEVLMYDGVKAYTKIGNRDLLLCCKKITSF